MGADSDGAGHMPDWCGTSGSAASAGDRPRRIRITRHNRQLQEPPERPVGSWLSPEWEALLREALSPDPRLRPQSVRQFVQALASRLPAIEPLFPSGVEILTRVARNLMTNSAHDDETVRNPSDRPPVPAWPVHETPFHEGHAPQNTAPAQADAASPISASPVTVNLRPASAAVAPAPAAPSANVVASPPTTLGSSTGTIEQSARAPRRHKRALLGLVAAGSVGVATIALVTVRGGGDMAPAAETVRQPAENPAPPPIQSLPTKGTNAARGPEVRADVGTGSATAAPATGTPATATPATTPPGLSAPSPAADRPRATSAAPPPMANHPAMLAHPATPRTGASSSPEPSRSKPAAAPAKAIPDRASVEPSKAGPGKHHVDRDEIGGQKED